LQDAVNAAAPGTALNVTGCGPYSEIVTITQPLTLIGASIRHATAALQSGDLEIRSTHDVVINGASVTNSSGACISADNSQNVVIEDSLMSNCVQEGYHFSGVSGLTFANNRVTGNNAAGTVDPSWEAGGGKVSGSTNVIFSNNQVDHNDGPGIWFDIQCSDVVIRNNRVHDNTYAGIMFEISTGARIYGNDIWSNGAGWAVWAWGAGILISSSGGTEIFGNVLAWNARSGVSVISQDRSNWSDTPPIDNYVHDNVTAALPNTWLMFWGQDWSGPMFLSASNNRGANDRFWAPGPETGAPRYAWNGESDAHLAAFNATPGEKNGTYLSTAELTSILAAVGIPMTAR
jgi:parallel beta-helix repeat protein